MALPRRRSWASMNARWGSQAEAEADAAATAVSGAAIPDAGGQGGGTCCDDPALTPKEPVATPGEFDTAAVANRFR